MTSGVHKLVKAWNVPFAMIPNAIIRDPEISPNAFRLLAYLMSHENGYELTYGQIERQTTLGRYAINEAVKVLTEKGYLEVTRPKLANGQFGSKSWVLLDPTSVGHSTMESSHVEPLPSGAISGHIEENLIKNTNLKEYKDIDIKIPASEWPETWQAKDLSLRERAFEDFWKMYPRKESKPQALKAFVKATKRAGILDIVAGLERYVNDPNRDPAYTKLAATWLNNDCWNDEPLPARKSANTKQEKNAEAAAKFLEAFSTPQNEITSNPDWA